MDKPRQWGTTGIAAGGGLPTLASVRGDLARVPLTRRITTIVFIVIAMLIARYSWQTPVTVIDGQGVKSNLTLPFFQDAERGLYDMRAAVATLINRTVPQDNRVLLVTFTPDTQFKTRERSPLDRTTLAKALTALDAMGPRAIGIDILIDQPQPDDQLLVDALNAMKTPVWVGYATVRHNPEDMSPWQQEYLDQFLAR